MGFTFWSQNIQVRLAILNIGQLATLAGPERPRIGLEMRELGLISHAGLMIEDGRIVAVAGSNRVEAEIDSRWEVIDAGGRLVTPGFVDAHTHSVFAGDRSNEFEMRCQGATYQEIKAAGGGIQASVRATQDSTEEHLFAESSEHLRWMLEHGTTCVEIKSGYGLSERAELKLMTTANRLGPQRVRTTFLGAHAVPQSLEKSAYLDSVIEMLPLAEQFADACDIFVEDGYFTADDARRLFEATSLPRRLHVDQFGDQGGAALAAELRAKTADHLEYTSRSGMQELRRAGVIPVLLPASVFCLGLAKYPEAREMISENLPVVLATDFNPGTAPCASLPFIMSLSCTQMKMTPAEALTACTVNAAHALDFGGEIGSIEPGKRADLVLHDASDYREIPYWTGRSTVEGVWIDGVCKFRKASGQKVR